LENASEDCHFPSGKATLRPQPERALGNATDVPAPTNIQEMSMAAKKPAKKAAKKAVKQAVKKVAPKKAAKKVAKKVAKKAARKPNAAFMKPMNIGTALAAVVGDKPLPRSEVTKKIWAYVKKNGLQDKVNKRMINADDKLLAVFGGKKQVSMFDMTKLVNQQLS
jgi:chromatin remodeling complex protein RSC6